MEILNLSASALFDALTRNNLDKSLLLEGTNLKLDDMLNAKKKHSWQNFVKLYSNIAQILGPEQAAREIAYTGIYNDDLTTLRKIATGLLNVRSLYWFIAKIGSRHLFKDAVKFEYKKLKSNLIQIEVNIAPSLEDCPLLFETYIYLYENVPTLLGLPKAKVTSEIYTRRAIYTIKLSKTSYFFSFFTRFTRELTGYSNAIEFIEELETYSLQLTQQVEVKSEILRIMSHDMANSVAVIDASIARIVKNNNLNDDDLNLILKARKGSHQLREILKNVKNIEVAYLKGVTLESINVDEVFKAIDENFSEKFSQKNIGLIIRNELPPYVNALSDKSSLEYNVLPNLLNNAYKFSNPGSFITLKATLIDEKVVITVEDQGVGMSTDEMNNIFANKIRNSKPGTAGETGSGLGLGIVKTYVQLYGGNISVKANYPTGTIFKITLDKAFSSNSQTLPTADSNYSHTTNFHH